MASDWDFWVRRRDRSRLSIKRFLSKRLICSFLNKEPAGNQNQKFGDILKYQAHAKKRKKEEEVCMLDLLEVGKLQLSKRGGADSPGPWWWSDPATWMRRRQPREGRRFWLKAGSRDVSEVGGEKKQTKRTNGRRDWRPFEESLKQREMKRDFMAGNYRQKHDFFFENRLRITQVSWAHCDGGSTQTTRDLLIF